MTVFLMTAGMLAAQTMPASYNPFTSGNLSALSTTDVVEGSYHRYSVPGDQNFGSEQSTFVWYVQGGTLGTFPAGSFVAASTTTLVDGDTIHVAGIAGPATVNGVPNVINYSEMWVEWDTDDGTDGYIAVFEISPDGCISGGIVGFQVNTLDAVMAWFDSDSTEVCSDDGTVSLTVELTIDPAGANAGDYYPLTLSYAIDGTPQTDITIDTGDVTDNAGQYYYTLTTAAMSVSDPNADESHTYLLTGIVDTNGAAGTIEDDGSTQFEDYVIVVHHLPQTGGMVDTTP